MLQTSPSRVEVGFSAAAALQKYCEILARGTQRIGPGTRLDRAFLDKQFAVAIDAAQFYADELAGHWTHICNMPIREIQAADNVDVSLGTLAGTLVLQRALPLFKYKYRVLGKLWSDFSATPGVYQQAEMTRIIITPAVQKYNGTAGADGRPIGFTTVQPAVTLDVPIVLSDYIGIPIVFSSGLLASTLRRIFDEQGLASVYAMSKYFISMITALLTPANYAAYAAVTQPDAYGMVKVPTAYPTYPVSKKNFTLQALTDVESAFDDNEVPEDERGFLMNAAYYGQLRQDPALALFFAAEREPGIIEEGKLPGRLAGFTPHKAPWLPATNNLVGFAFHKAGIVLKQRLPTDFTEALGVMVPGSVTTVVDPESGLSALLVQYVNLQQNYAEWRLESLLGVGPGDRRGGLCLTSQ